MPRALAKRSLTKRADCRFDTRRLPIGCENALRTIKPFEIRSIVMTLQPLCLSSFAGILLLSACLSSALDETRNASLDSGSVEEHWLSGCWQHIDGPSREVWVEAATDLLFGYSVTTSGDQLRSFEDLRIEPSEAGHVYVASPNGTTPVRFTETHGTDVSLRFENPDHDFPQRIEYFRDHTTLTATISNMDRSQSFEIAMRACDK